MKNAVAMAAVPQVLGPDRFRLLNDTLRVALELDEI
jgi:hypothetical protein